MKVPVFSDKKLYPILHSLAWAILFILPFYLMNFNEQDNIIFIKSYYLKTTINVALFYFNYLWFVPKYLLKANIKKYIFSLSLLLICLFIINWKGHEYFFYQLMSDDNLRKTFEELQKSNEIPKQIPQRYHIYDFLVTSLMITGFSIGLRISGKLIQNEKEKKELEKEKLNSELAFLKNQISPHFFFNTLNNIYSLIQIDTNNAQDAVLKLSKLMRYLLYESEKNDTDLAHEIEFMNNYIDLMKLRITTKTDLQVSFPQQFVNCPVQPLLFISFIENAFKHGISNREQSFVHISLSQSDNKLEFICKNSVNKSTSLSTDNQGIGLENIKKRLSLLYPSSHELKIEERQDTYSVTLLIYTNKK